MNRNIRILYLIAFLQGMVFYGPIATLYRQVHGISVFEITIIEGISLGLSLLLEIPWGVIADRIGYKKTMAFCTWLYFISKIIFYQASSFYGFLLERILLGIVFAGISGVDTSILYLSCNGKDVQKVYGNYESLGMLGLLLASFIFSFFIKDDYQLAALLTVVAYGIASILVLLVKEVKDNKGEEACNESFKNIFRSVIKNKRLLLFLIATGLLSETHQTITVFLNQLKYESVGLSNSAIGILFGIMSILGLVACFSEVITKKLKILGSFITLTTIPITSCLFLFFSNNIPITITSIMMLQIANSIFTPFREELQNRQVTATNRATALSIHSMIINCTAIIVSLLFGYLSDIKLTYAFLFGGIISFISLLILLYWHFGNKTYS